MSLEYVSPWTIHTLDDLDITPPDALANVKAQREWLRQHGFDYSLVEWPDGLIALIVHPLSEAPKADRVRELYEQKRRESGKETLYEQLLRADSDEVLHGH